jgi:hypothetical protein
MSSKYDNDKYMFRTAFYIYNLCMCVCVFIFIFSLLFLLIYFSILAHNDSINTCLKKNCNLKLKLSFNRILNDLNQLNDQLKLKNLHSFKFHLFYFYFDNY